MENCSCECDQQEKCSIIDFRREMCCHRCTYYEAGVKSGCARLPTRNPYDMIKELMRYRKTERLRFNEFDFMAAFQ